MKLSIFLAISIDNFPSISRQAVRLSWSLSSMFTCDPLHSAIQFPNEVPSKYNAELCSHAAFDVKTGSRSLIFVPSPQPYFLKRGAWVCVLVITMVGRAGAAQGQPWVLSGRWPDQSRSQSEVRPGPGSGAWRTPGQLGLFSCHNNGQVSSRRN